MLPMSFGNRCAFFLTEKLCKPLDETSIFIGELFRLDPLVVGSAALSRVRFVEGSVAYGAMLSAFAIGAVAGTLVDGAVLLAEA